MRQTNTIDDVRWTDLYDRDEEITRLTKQRDELVAAFKKLEAIAGTGSNAKEIAQQALATVKEKP